MVKNLSLNDYQAAEKALFTAQSALIPACSCQEQVMQHIDDAIFELHKLRPLELIVEAVLPSQQELISTIHN